jgi:hypothetical protein
LNPVAETLTLYRSSSKTIKPQTKIGYPRLAHLEEKEKLAKVWVGDSDATLDKHPENYKNSLPALQKR